MTATPTASRAFAGEDAGLADLLDRLLHKGVVLTGEVTISVAGVDLLYIGVQALAGTVDAARTIVRGSCGPGDAHDA